MAGTNLFAVDNGRIMAISYGKRLRRYIKIEHRWGESFYAHVGDVQVEAGQLVKRNDAIAASGPDRLGIRSHLRFAIRVTPYNPLRRLGRVDRFPFLNPSNIVRPTAKMRCFIHHRTSYGG